KKDHGVFFFDVSDGQTSVGQNNSCFNTYEAIALVEITEQLLENGFKAENIAIITPYREQAHEISRSFNIFDHPYIGTINEVQGLEFDIVLFSAVRTDQFGFLDSPKLNVALSRAKYLLVIFGNEQFLTNDLDWRNLIAYTVQENAYQSYVSSNFKMF
uniref:DNA2/NAM7 helicase-like C-terminal domain-containing protein n=1 Tax=Megaselia scalaris TaxID=36166 RepID=T1H3E4_MEGSC